MALKPYRATAHWKRLRLQVLNRDAWTCAYCGGVADQVDHVWPKSRGGEDTLDNCVAACKACNYAKRDKDQAVFLAQQSTPPAFPDSLSPKRAKQSKSVQIGHTTVRIDPGNPFIDPDHSGANKNA